MVYVLLAVIIFRLVYVNVTVGPLHSLLNEGVDILGLLMSIVSIVVTALAIQLFYTMTRMLLKRGDYASLFLYKNKKRTPYL